MDNGAKETETHNNVHVEIFPLLFLVPQVNLWFNVSMNGSWIGALVDVTK